MDGAGAVYGDKEPLKRIYEVANAPIFTYDEIYFTGEVVGGPMLSPAEGGQLTAAVAVRMLGGEKAGGIKVPPIEFSAPKYDWRQLQRWNISESRLPPGSQVLFREPTAWERYSWQIGLIAAVVLIQAGLISRSCCMSIVGDNWPKCSHGSARQSLLVSIASRPPAS